MKQETLEEAAERHYINCIPSDRHSFIAGASWQSKRMYSEEEVLELLWKREWSYEHSMPFITVDDWFEQFKKK